MRVQLILLLREDWRDESWSILTALVRLVRVVDGGMLLELSAMRRSSESRHEGIMDWF